MPRDGDHFADAPHLALSIRRSLRADESRNMGDLLQCDAGMNRRPIAQNVRVRNMGRTLRERGEVSYWFHEMTRTPETPRGPTPVNETYNASVQPTPAVETTGAVLSDKPAGMETREVHNKEPKDSVSKLESLSLAELTVQNEVQNEKEDSSYQQQLDKADEQKPRLVDRECGTEDKIEQSSKKSAAPDEVHEQRQDTDVAMTAPAEVDKASSSTTVIPSAKFEDVRRRRLKGSLARSFARRDEGTVGSLLWTSEKNESMPPTVSSMSCVSAARLANLKQESSSNICSLLLHNSHQEDNSSTKGSGKCGGTIQRSSQGELHPNRGYLTGNVSEATMSQSECSSCVSQKCGY